MTTTTTTFRCCDVIQVAEEEIGSPLRKCSAAKAESDRQQLLAHLRIDNLEMLVAAMRAAVDHDGHNPSKLTERQRPSVTPRLGLGLGIGIGIGTGIGTGRNDTSKRVGESSQLRSVSFSQKHSTISTLPSPRKFTVDKIQLGGLDRPEKSSQGPLISDRQNGGLRKGTNTVSNPYLRIAQPADIDRYYAGGRKVSFNNELVMIDVDGSYNRVSVEK